MANSAGKESVAWCSWHSCWCKERNRALWQGNWLPSPLSATVLPVYRNSYSKVENDCCGCTHTGKPSLSLCVQHLSYPAKNAEFCYCNISCLCSPDREKQFPKWSGKVTNTEKIFLRLGICCHLSMAWLWYCLSWFLLSFKELCSQFIFLTQWSAKPSTLMPNTGANLSHLFLCAIIQTDMETYWCDCAAKSSQT